MNARIDQVALLPTYVAAATAVLAFVVDLIAPGRRGPVLTATALGTVATGVTAWIVGAGHVRGAFCVPAGCSLVADRTGALVAVLFAVLTLVVLALCVPAIRGGAPSGEYCFLIAASMTGGVVLGYSHDLITLVVALETLTLPLYPMVALRRRSIASAEGAVVFYVVSVVSSAITLMGAALLYAVTGALHFDALRTALAADAHARDLPLTWVAVVLVLVGLGFKVAAVPMHAWAPAAYDGAPTPVAAYLSTASKLGGVIAIVYVTVRALGPSLSITGPILAALAAATMTVGNLVALRQDRMVRLLAWSSVAQSGYILAPLGALALARGRTDALTSTAVAATIAYTIFYVVLELGAFASVIAVRGAEDGGSIEEYRGLARRAPWIGATLMLAFVGLAGLPPGFAGLFGKVVIIRSLLSGGSAWLAVVVAANAVIGLAYYARAVATLFGSASSAGLSGSASSAGLSGSASSTGHGRRIAWSVTTALALVTVAGLVIGLAPQLVLHAVDLGLSR
jgi:NADH-quinone oxidoreductase subunit N